MNRRFAFLLVTLVLLILLSACRASGSTATPRPAADTATPWAEIPPAVAPSPTAPAPTAIPAALSLPTATWTPPAISPTPIPLIPITPPAQQTATFTPIPSCPGAPPITLAVGQTAMVSTDPPTPNNVRSLPGVGANILGVVNPGEMVAIVGGPKCSDGYAWWKVRTAGGLIGWTAEGDGDAYWLVKPPTPTPVSVAMR